MRVVACSSGCCGIKHIRDFPYRADYKVYVDSSEGHDEDQSSSEPPAYDPWNIQPEGGVKPIASDYLVDLVAHIKERRPRGMITVNLAAYDESDGYDEDDAENWGFGGNDYDSACVDSWRPVLEGLGFSETTFYNSNSGNRVHHFVLIY